MSKIIIYLSLVFLVVFLYQKGWTTIPRIEDYSALVLSFVLLCFGFVLQGFSWHVILRLKKVPVSFPVAYESFSMTIFGKYIPGKIWVLVGPASYVKKEIGSHGKSYTNFAGQLQIINILVGLLIGLLSFQEMVSQEKIYIFLGLMSVVFLAMDRHLLSKLLGKIKSEKLHAILDNNFLSFWEKLIVMMVTGVRWSAWIVAFALLVYALDGKTMGLEIGFFFAFAGVVGVMALFAPGGLGVREGILTAMLVGYGLSVEFATAVAIASRVWFLGGEVFAFSSGMLVKALRQRKIRGRKEEAVQ